MKATTQSHISNQSWKSIIFFLKTILVIGMLALLYYQIFNRDNINDLSRAFTSSLNWSNGWLLALTILLLPVNWLLESFKWKTIVSSFSDTSLRESIKVILGGLSFGILTPSRIGEYGGRFYMTEDEDRWKTISATFVGSLSQNIITALLGLAGASYLLYYSQVMTSFIATSIWYVASIAIIIGLLFYYNIGFIQHIVRFLPGKWARLCDTHSNFLSQLNPSILNKILLVSFFRYLIYALQYILMLHFFGISVHFAEAGAAVSLIFLIQSGLPFPPVLDVLARGEIALTIWALYSGNTLGILACTFSIWIINLIIPALIGLIYVIMKEPNS
ncbi:MAG: hypothetical protein HKN68_07065 [Saprospiraceae bacterium]|nr:hypothetical protein [Saprospiraceae bacterium]